MRRIIRMHECPLCIKPISLSRAAYNICTPYTAKGRIGTECGSVAHRARDSEVQPQDNLENLYATVRILEYFDCKKSFYTYRCFCKVKEFGVSVRQNFAKPMCKFVHFKAYELQTATAEIARDA